MLSFLTLPFLASAALGASHLPRRDFHHHLARDLSATASVTNATVDMIAAAYYAGWHGVGNSYYNFTLDDVAWTKYTHLIYAFAVTDPAAPENATLADSDVELLTEFVAKAKNNSVKAMLSIGGWTGGRAFSTNVGSAENRTAFVKTVVGLKNQFQLDGIDFDWEYPNDAGIGCNAVSPNDTANFLTFLQELRADPDGKDLILSAATPVLPWKDETGSPSTDVSGFSKVLDFITIMNYDVWGSWSSAVGPNSPLNDTCAAAANQMGSAVSAVKAWTAAGMPAHQIVLGVASYGHSFTVPPSAAFTSGDDNTLAAYPAFNSTSFPLGDGWDGPQGTDVCGVTNNNPGGNWDYWGLVSEGWVWPNGTARPGIESRFDECSQTPYVYNKTSQIMVSFDDPAAFKAKGEFILSAGLRGFNIWEAGGDFKDYLLDAISVATGMQDEDDGDCGDDRSSTAPVVTATISVHASAGTPAVTHTPEPVAPSPVSGGGNNDASPSPPAAHTTAPVLANGGNGGDDDDCDDESSSSPAAATATPTPVNNSGSGDDDDCDDDEPSTTPAAATPTPTSTGGDDDCDD